MLTKGRCEKIHIVFFLYSVMLFRKSVDIEYVTILTIYDGEAMKKPKKEKKKNIRFFLGELVVALFVYFTVIMAICYIRFDKTLEQDAKDELSTYFTSIARDLSGKLIIERNTVSNSVPLISDSNGDSETVEFALNRASELSMYDDTHAYVDKNGLVISGGNSVEEQTLQMQEYIKGWTVPDYDWVKTADGAGHILLNEKIDGEDGKPFAVVSSLLNFSEFKKTIEACGNRNNILYLVTDVYGNIYMTENKIEDYVLGGENLFDDLLKSNMTPSDIASVRSNVRIKSVGWKDYKKNKSKYVVFYNYTGFEDLFIVGIAEQEIIDTAVGKRLSSLSMLIRHICMGCFAFLFAYIFFMIKDRRQYAEEKKELQDQSETDHLTGLLNKIATEDHIAKYLEAAKKDQMGALFLIDLDNFKKINDTLGHAFGDEVLKKLGQALRKEFRVEDIVGRIGGDEFIVFVENVKSVESIKKEATRLERFFKEFRVGEYVKYAVTASVGIAFSPNDGKSFKELYLRADQALYYSKDAGKNRISFYDGSIMCDTSLPKNRNHDEIES